MTHEQFREGVSEHARDVIETCRLLMRREPRAIDRARAAQVAEYAELLLDRAQAGCKRPPGFAGRLNG
jgi:hypothetical protein